MRRLARYRPSPALVVAIVAFVVACAGTATAARVLIRDSSEVARGAINSGDLANGKGVNLRDLTPRTRVELRGSRGPEGDQGSRGAQGPQGPRGLQGEPGADGEDGSAIAFAYVNADGSLDDSKSKGVASVAISPTFPDTSGDNGVYCFDLLPAARNAVASLDFTSLLSSGGSGLETIYPVMPGNASGSSSAFIASNCPGAQQDAAVVVVNAASSSDFFPQQAFWISFN
jgi:hypothetical protein